MRVDPPNQLRGSREFLKRVRRVLGLQQFWLALFLALPTSAGARGALAIRPIGVPGSHLQLIDLTGEYDRIWRETTGLPTAERVKLFKARFSELLPGFYDSSRLAKFGVTPQQYDEFLGKVLAKYPEKRASTLAAARQFRTQLGPAVHAFEHTFGPLRGYPPIYLVNANNEFDGGTRDLPQGTRLLFGADVIARVYKDRPIKPFFEHELFHMMHARTFSECDQVWCSLWFEGMATYVAGKLNPGASDHDISLDVPVPLRQPVDAHLNEAICAVASRLDSRSPADFGPLFTTDAKPLSPNLPSRFGYYVGFLVAQDLGRTRTLKQLASLTHEEARPLIEASLRSMAKC